MKKVMEFGRWYKLRMQEPYSDRLAYMDLAVWGFNTLLTVLTIGMNLFRPTHFSLFWLVLNTCLGALYVVFLTWAVQGLLYRRAERRKEAEFHQFVEIVVNGYSK